MQFAGRRPTLCVLLWLFRLFASTFSSPFFRFNCLDIRYIRIRVGVGVSEFHAITAYNCEIYSLAVLSGRSRSIGIVCEHRKTSHSSASRLQSKCSNLIFDERRTKSRKNVWKLKLPFPNGLNVISTYFGIFAISSAQYSHSFIFHLSWAMLCCVCTLYTWC